MSETTEKIQPTPETDAAEYLISVGRKNDEWLVQSDFARKLERERDEARELLASEKITRDHVIKRGIEMQKERDEARADSAQLADRLSGLELRTTEELARMERERDAARSRLATVTKRYDASKRARKSLSDACGFLQDQERIANDKLATVTAQRDEAREALRDMLSGWRYIRFHHGDLYGVGWDRSQAKAEKALEGAK